MSSKTKQVRIRPLEGYPTLEDGEVLARGVAAVKGVGGDPATYSAPPVNLADLGTKLGKFSDAIAASLDGGAQAVSVKDELREEIVTDLILLGAYVSAVSKGVMSTFMSSGFLPRPTTRSAAAPLRVPSIRRIDQGNSGTLLIWITALDRARGYDVRRAALTNGVLGPSTIQTATQAKSAIVVDGLTPTTEYVFQVRALGTAGYTDWSNSSSRICI